MRTVRLHSKLLAGCDISDRGLISVFGTRISDFRLCRAVGIKSFALTVLLAFGPTAGAGEAPQATVGAYYFDGWAGQNAQAGKADWAKDAPTHLTKRMLDEFPDREPVWGWRDDKLETMERQIDLAADHGIAFFAICWYFRPTQKQVDDDPLHTGLNFGEDTLKTRS
jgi:hypothetical protein